MHQSLWTLELAHASDLGLSPRPAKYSSVFLIWEVAMYRGWQVAASRTLWSLGAVGIGEFRGLRDAPGPSVNAMTLPSACLLF